MPFNIIFTQDTFAISGDLDENADISKLYEHPGLLKIDFGGVISINSVGIAKLIQLTSRRAGFRLEFHRCPESLVQAINVIPMILGPKADPSVVKSAFVPFFCTNCKLDVRRLVSIAELGRQGRSIYLPPMTCPKCTVFMSTTEDSEDYFGFLIDPASDA